MDSDLLGRADAIVGDGIEALVRAHHRRRLVRAGWGRAFVLASRLWADGRPPPRTGNDVELLIDGASFLPRLTAELERAESHVHIAGWYLSTELALVREGRRRVLLDLLGEVARKVDVRVLLWAGAPLPLFRPSRAQVRDVAKRLRGVGVRVALDAKEAIASVVAPKAEKVEEVAAAPVEGAVPAEGAAPAAGAAGAAPGAAPGAAAPAAGGKEEKKKK